MQRDSCLITVRPRGIPLLRINFSPIALHIDKLASKFDLDSVLGVVLRTTAQLLSRLTCHTLVELSVDDDYPRDDNEPMILGSANTSWLLSEAAIESQEQLLNGNNVAVRESSVAVILLWGLTGAHSHLEAYTLLKRAARFCKLTVEQNMLIPLAYTMYRQEAYFPSQGLIAVCSSKRFDAIAST